MVSIGAAEPGFRSECEFPWNLWPRSTHYQIESESNPTMKIPYATLITALTTHFTATETEFDAEDFDLAVPAGKSISLKVEGAGEVDYDTFENGLVFNVLESEDEEEDEEDDSPSKEEMEREEILTKCAEMTATVAMTPSQMAIQLGIGVKTVAKALNHSTDMSIVGPKLEEGKVRQRWMVHGTPEFEAAVAEETAICASVVETFRPLIVKVVKDEGKIKQENIVGLVNEDTDGEIETSLLQLYLDPVIGTLLDEKILYRRSSGKLMMHKLAA